MKLPKKFYAMNLDEQEKYLVDKHEKCTSELEGIKRLLAAVRGGDRVEVRVDERPDETSLKYA